ncbi:MAG: nucleoid occlusion protein [Clostridiales bacterium]|nr:nucleoid occlusion protein [Clostridiales bacterium]
MNEAWKKLINIDEAEIDQGETQVVPVENIRPNPFQPRKTFDAGKIDELAQSIRTYGLLQPILVRKEKEDVFQLIAGERRLMACKSLGWTHINAVIRTISDSAMATIALIENLQREDLNFIEEAEGYGRLLEEFGLTQEVLAQRLGKSQPTIANKLRLLKLPSRVKELLLSQDLTERHARALLRLPDEEIQMKVVNEIFNLGYTVKQTEKRVDEIINNQAETVVKERKKVIIRDIRIFLNTIRQAVSILETGGLGPKMTEKDHGDFLEITIRLPKKREKVGNKQAIAEGGRVFPR